jgi:phosphopentomutase
LLVAGRMVRAGTDLGTRATFADLGATVVELLGLPPLEVGTSFARDIMSQT